MAASTELSFVTRTTYHVGCWPTKGRPSRRHSPQVAPLWRDSDLEHNAKLSVFDTIEKSKDGAKGRLFADNKSSAEERAVMGHLPGFTGFRTGNGRREEGNAWGAASSRR